MHYPEDPALWTLQDQYLYGGDLLVAPVIEAGAVVIPAMPSFYQRPKTIEDVAEHLGQVKDAVQPGRRIVTLRHKQVGVSVATAFMSPGVDALEPFVHWDA